jgi:hypothetical protein
MLCFDTAPQFRSAGPAASALIDYLDAQAELNGRRWDFERGMVSSNGRSRAWAEFSQDGASDISPRDRVSIIAVQTVAGGWNIAHTVTRAGR